MTNCIAPACQRAAFATGMCKMHYRRFARNGAFDLPVRPTDDERFFSFVLKTDGCWLWRGATAPGGYGVFSVRHKNVRASHYSYTRFVGQLSPGQQALHRCDNPPCVRPDHLFAGTQGDNMRDCVAKGRLRPGGTFGEAHPSAKLTAEIVKHIRAAHADGASLSELGRRHGVTPQSIGAVVRRESWKHV